MRYKNQKGFTLIELMMVLAIVALLSSVALFAFINARIKARNARRAVDLSQLQKGLEIYYTKNDSNYPHGGAVANSLQAYDISALSTFLTPDSLTNIPNDPSFPAGSNYQYMWSSNGDHYAIKIYMDNEVGGTACAYRSPGGSALFGGSGTTPDCNFQ